MKKFLAVFLAIVSIFTISGCSLDKKTAYMKTANNFTEKIKESYVNILRTAAVLSVVYGAINKSNPNSLKEYSDLVDSYLAEAVTRSEEYTAIIISNAPSISELYSKLLKCPDEYKVIKNEAKNMYELYLFLLECVTADFENYLSWFAEFEDEATEFEESLEKMRTYIAP